MARKNPNKSKHSYVRQLGLEKVVKRVFGIHTKGRIQPAVAVGRPRKWVRKYAERWMRMLVQEDNAKQNRNVRSVARKADKQGQKFQAKVNRLTNWQRTQWARAGYPGLSHKETKPLKKFLVLQKPN